MRNVGSQLKQLTITDNKHSSKQLVQTDVRRKVASEREHESDVSKFTFK